MRFNILHGAAIAALGLAGCSERNNESVTTVPQPTERSETRTAKPPRATTDVTEEQRAGEQSPEAASATPEALATPPATVASTALPVSSPTPRTVGTPLATPEPDYSETTAAVNAVRQVETTLGGLSSSDPISSATIEQAQAELQRLQVLVNDAEAGDRLPKEMRDAIPEASMRLQERLQNLGRQQPGSAEYQQELEQVRQGMNELRSAAGAAQ